MESVGLPTIVPPPRSPQLNPAERAFAEVRRQVDGTQNLTGALNICLGMVGAENIREMHEVAEVVVAPSIKTEGKHYQLGLE